MYNVVVIGAGPAGISMAVEAEVAGIAPENILVLEKAHQHSFSIRKYYPDSKLVTANYKGFEAVCTGTMCIPDLTKHETISYLDKAIQDYSITVQYEETVWKIEHHEEEQYFTIITDKGTYESKVIAIAIGILGKPNKPEYKLPHTLKDRLLFDITTSDVKDAHVLVVGGGDTASEYCQYLVEHNKSVTLSYRKNEFSRMNDINRTSIEALGTSGQVQLLLNSDIAEVKDAQGIPEVHFVQEDLGVKHYDYIVYALGGTTPENFLRTIGIEFTGKDPVLKEGYETNIPGMFLLGDLSAGTKGGSIIWAFNSANTAMKRIIEKYVS